MSVRAYPDNGPSYVVHEPAPGAGPAVCSRCVHVRKRGMPEPQFCKAWTCGAVPGKVIRQAGVDPITGEPVPMLVDRPWCTDRNKQGDCPDFQTDGATERIATPKVGVDAAALSALAFFIAGACIGGIVASML